MFAHVSPELWEGTGHDPVALLGAVDQERLRELAADEGFVAWAEEQRADLRAYVREPRWYQQLEGDVPEAIGYFSPEFGIAAALPQYSGGLGILAGDHLKSASDLGVPLVGVGLFYPSGYFRQGISSDGWQQETYPVFDPDGLPLQVLRDADGAPVHVALELPADRTLHARIWQARVGRIPLLLLDTDVPENDDDLRGVTDRLYGGGGEHRLHQELLLGIGGVRAIAAHARVTGAPVPRVFHTNEGHAGFLGVERISTLMADGLDFDEALQVVRAGTVFTTHTPVPRASTGSTSGSSGSTGPTGCCRASRRSACSGSVPRPTTADRPTSSTWRSWASASRSAPTASRSCTARSAAACSPGSGRGSTPTRCRSRA